MQDSTRERLSAELEAAALRAVLDAWNYVNWERFQTSMRAPEFVLSDARTRLGQWIPRTRTLEIGMHTLTEHSWGVVLEVLKHEMAHQYVDEVLHKHDETAHGEAFQRVCADRGIDARATGVPQGDSKDDARTSVLEKIAKLLALAESPNEHEAQLAMNMAQKLMLKHNLESVSNKVSRGYGYRHLGEPSGRVDESRRLLGAILREHFFVETIWISVWRVREGKRGSVLEVCGTPDNLEMAEYVWSFLTHTAEGLWKQHKRDNHIRADRDRRDYLAGVMTGFYEKLGLEKKSNKEQGLVWIGDPELARFYKQRHPRVHSIRTAGRASSEAREHGREAGRNIVLRKGVSGGSSSGSGRLLGSGRGD